MSRDAIEVSKLWRSVSGASFAERADDYLALDRAPAEDVPDRKRADQKSRALIALQLIKRWRNVLFDQRERAKLRRPPSVLLTKLIGDNANQTRSLAEELEHQAGCMLARFEYEVRRNTQDRRGQSALRRKTS